MLAKRTILILFVLAIIIRLLYFIIIPLGQAPDEIVHFRQIYEKALSWRFPREYPQKNIGFISRYPPLYYYLGAAIMSPLLSRPVPALPQAFSQYGNFLRFFSLIISLITLYLTTGLILKLYPRLSLIALPVLYFWPQWTASSIWINMDPLFLLLMVINISLCIKYLTKPYKHRYPIILGILAGLTLLTKPLAPALVIGTISAISISNFWKKNKSRISSYSSSRPTPMAIGGAEGSSTLGKAEDFSTALAPYRMVLGLRFARNDNQSLKRNLLKFKAILIYLSVILAVTFWYYLVNYLTTGNILASDLLKNELAIYTSPFSFPFYILGVAWWTIQTFIASFGPTNNIRLPEVIYLSMSLLILWLLIFSLRKFDSLKRFLIKNNKLKLFMTIISVALIFSILQFFYINFFISFQPQGRYLFPLFLLFPIAIASLLHAQGPALNSQLFSVVLSVILIFLNLYGLHCISSRYQKFSLLPIEAGCVYQRVRLTPWQEEIINKVNFKMQRVK